MTTREHSLAEKVLSSRVAWLSEPSVPALKMFLRGAHLRCRRTKTRPHEIYGPFFDSGFWDFLFSTEQAYLDFEDAFSDVEVAFGVTGANGLQVLREGVSSWKSLLSRDREPFGNRGYDDSNSRAFSWDEFWQSLPETAADHFEDLNRGRYLLDWLRGMTIAESWFSLDRMSAPHTLLERIADHSKRTYDSPREAYFRETIPTLLDRMER